MQLKSFQRTQNENRSELYDLDFAFVPYSCKDIKFKKRPRRYGQKIDLNLTGVDLQKHDYLVSLSKLRSDSGNS